MKRNKFLATTVDLIGQSLPKFDIIKVDEHAKSILNSLEFDIYYLNKYLKIESN